MAGRGWTNVGRGLTGSVAAARMLRTWPPTPRSTRPRSGAEAAAARPAPGMGRLLPVMETSASEDPVGLDALLGGLNPDQFRAVTHGEGPLLVVAGAGTGKTQVITRRIAWLIATRRARPSEILALTFTDKAAEEMALRVDQLVPYGYTDTAISRSTHSATDSSASSRSSSGCRPTCGCYRAPRWSSSCASTCSSSSFDQYRPLGNPTRFLAALAALFSRCKDEDIAPAAYLAFAEGLRPRRSRARRQRDARTPHAPARKRRAGSASSPGPTRATRLASRPAVSSTSATRSRWRSGSFGSPPRPANAIQARFRYILVDEFQDTNRAQAELVGLLAERHRNVTVVGDDDQAIYAFRGAAVDNILEFEARYRGARTVVLRRNYRSLAPVLDAAYRLVRFNDPDRLEVRTGISKRLRAERVTVDPIRFVPRPSRAGPRRRIGWPLEIGRRIATGPNPATMQSWCVRTTTPIRSFARSTWPGSRGGSRLFRVVRPARGPPPDVVPARRRGPVLQR